MKSDVESASIGFLNSRLQEDIGWAGAFVGQRFESSIHNTFCIAFLLKSCE